MEVVLKWIGDEPLTHPDPALTLVQEPAFLPQRPVHIVVEGLVVRKLDVAAVIPGEAVRVLNRRREAAGPRASLHHQKISLACFDKPESRTKPGRTCAEYQETGHIFQGLFRRVAPLGFMPDTSSADREFTTSNASSASD